MKIKLLTLMAIVLCYGICNTNAKNASVSNTISKTRTSSNLQVCEDWSWGGYQDIDSCRWRFDSKNKVALLQYCSKESSEIIIPEIITYDNEEYTVVAVGYSNNIAFGSNAQKIIFPNSLRYIGNYAIYDIAALETIIIPENVYYIGASFGRYCNNLKEINLPMSLESIGDNFCYDSQSLQSLIMGDVKNIGGGFCERATNLQSLIIGETENIGSYFCYGATNLQTLTIGDAVNIGDYFCSDATNLQTLTIGSVENIGRNFCSNTKKLNAFTLPANVKTIGYNFFNESNITEIKSRATAPPTIESIGSQLRTIYVPAGSGKDYSSTLVWKDKIIVDGDGVSVAVNVNKPGTLGEEILKQTEYVRNVNFLTISGTLNSDDYYQIKENMPNLLSIDLSGTDLTELPAEMFYNRHAIKSIKLPEKLISIGRYSFYNCNSLENVIIPESVTFIDEYAFSNCYALKTVKLPINLQRINSGAFYSSGISEIELPENLNSVGSHAFYYCENLTYIKIPSSVKIIENAAFSNCTNLSAVTLNEGLVSLGDGSFSYTDLSEIVLPSSLVTCTTPFYGCKNLKKVTSCSLFPPYIESNYGLFNYDDMEGRTLCVPALSLSKYKLTKGWDNFPVIEPINTYFMPENIVIHEPVEFTLPDGLTAEYKPNVSLAETTKNWYYQYGSVVMSGNSTLSIGQFNMVYNPYYYVSGYSDNSTCYASLVNNANMRADHITISLYIRDDRWAFLSFPFDVKVSDIVPMHDDVNFVIRKYSGKARAEQDFENTWQNMTSDSILHAGEGYIWQCSRPSDSYSGFYVSAINNSNKNLIFANNVRSLVLNDYQSEFSHNRSWNLIGNPYPCFYDTRMMDFSAPITVWNDQYRTYEAYSPVDDEYILRPGEAFFVQRPIETETLNFDPNGRQVNNTVPERSKVRKYVPFNDERQVYNLVLSGEESSDKTRFVINNNAVVGYETNCDACKFMSDDSRVSQLYTIEQGIDMAINERPKGNGLVELGTYFGKDGEYTISMKTNSIETVILVDNLTGTETLMNNNSYTFHAEQGKTIGRFRIKVGQGETGINNAEVALEKVIVSNNQILVCNNSGKTVALYTTDGKLIYETWETNAVFNVNSGVYIIKEGENTHKVVVP